MFYWNHSQLESLIGWTLILTIVTNHCTECCAVLKLLCFQVGAAGVGVLEVGQAAVPRLPRVGRRGHREDVRRVRELQPQGRALRERGAERGAGARRARLPRVSPLRRPAADLLRGRLHLRGDAQQPPDDRGPLQQLRGARVVPLRRQVELSVNLREVLKCLEKALVESAY